MSNRAARRRADEANVSDRVLYRCAVAAVLGALVVGWGISECLLCRPAPSSVRSERLGNVGDQNGDGADDVMWIAYEVDRRWNWLGGWLPNRRRATSDLRLVSGRDGELLRVMFAPGSAWGALGAGSLGDVDGDGTDDYVVGGVAAVGDRDERVLAAYSRADRHPLWKTALPPREPTDETAYETLRVVRDDAGPLVAIRSPGGGLEWIDGRTGDPAGGRASPGSRDPDALVVETARFHAIDDVDGDATADLVHRERTDAGAWTARVLSGADGSELPLAAPPVEPSSRLPAAAIDDVDGDGLRDTVVALGDGRFAAFSGRACLWVRRIDR